MSAKAKLKPTETLVGVKFGRLTVIGLHTKANDGSRIWECKCKCGKMKYASTWNLRRGHTKSCGCLQSENGTKQARVNNELRNFINANTTAIGLSSYKHRSSMVRGSSSLSDYRTHRTGADRLAPYAESGTGKDYI